jgi:hypothetical protein
LARGRIPAHEFHYAALEVVAPEVHFAYRVRREAGVDSRSDGVVIGFLMVSFSHLGNMLARAWVERLVEFAQCSRVGAISRAQSRFDERAARAEAHAANLAGRP